MGEIRLWMNISWIHSLVQEKEDRIKREKMKGFSSCEAISQNCKKRTDNEKGANGVFSFLPELRGTLTTHAHMGRLSMYLLDYFLLHLSRISSWAYQASTYSFFNPRFLRTYRLYITTRYDSIGRFNLRSFIDL